MTPRYQSRKPILLLLVALLWAPIMFAQSFKTVDYNKDGIQMVENSIIVWVKPDNAKKMSPVYLNKIEETKRSISAVINTELPKFGIEEWKINGDVDNALKELNAIPGVVAFPNYAFQRESMDIKPFDENALREVKLQRIAKSLEAAKNPELPTTQENIIYFEDFEDMTLTGSGWTTTDNQGSGYSFEWVRFEEDVADTAVGLFNTSGIDGTFMDVSLISPVIDLTSLDPNMTVEISVDVVNPGFFPETFLLVSDVNDFVSDGIDIWGDSSRTYYMDLTPFIGYEINLEFLSQLSVDSGVLAISVDDIMIVAYEGPPTNDPYLLLQYALNNDGSFNLDYSVEDADIDAFEAWNYTTGNHDVVIAVFDDGVDFDHPDLAANAWYNPLETENGIDDDGNGYVDDINGWSPIYGDNSYLNPGSFHGTHVAGIIGAVGNNGEGISGVAQNVSILSVMIFDDWGWTSSLAIMEGYYYLSTLLDNGIEITAVNQSWGGGRYMLGMSDARFIDVMTEFALYHNNYGTLWVISAGNSASDRDNLPFYSIPNNIQSPNIITVASTDDADELSYFSDYGIFNVDIAAPGSNILSTVPLSTTNMEYAFLSGTSMSSPHVTGAIALAKAMNPDESGHGLIVKALGTSDNLTSLESYVNEGNRLNAYGMADFDALVEKTAPGNITVAGLIQSHETAKLRKTFLDTDGVVVVGFSNDSGSDVTINSATLSGGENSAFELWDDIAGTVVNDGYAFGMPVSFYNFEQNYDQVAEVLTLSTTAGDVTINLLAEEQSYGFVDIYPDFNDFGVVAYGDTLLSQFTIDNTEGSGDLNYNLEFFLMHFDEDDMFNQNAASLKEKFAPDHKPKQGEKINPSIQGQELMPIIQKGLSGITRHQVTLSPENPVEVTSDDLMVFWIDDMEDETFTNTAWTFMSFGDSGENFNRFDLGSYIGEDPNHVLLAGDFDWGYENSTIAVAASPIFDFSALEVDGDIHSPAFLEFDYAALLEYGWDHFYINVIQDGFLVNTLAITAGWSENPLYADGGKYHAFLDISYLSGMDNVEFWFIFNSDDIYADGWGAYFDNVALVSQPSPFFVQPMSGTIEAGSAADIDVTVHTGRLMTMGQHLLFIDVYSDAVNRPGYSGWHALAFDSRMIYVELSPEYDDIGVVDRGSQIQYDYLATNLGAVDADVNFFSGLSLNWDDDWFDGPSKVAMDPNKVPTKPDFKAVNKKLMLLPVKSASNQQLKNTTKPYKSKFMPTIQGGETFFEDFEAGLPEDWTFEDYSFGLGSEFSVLDVSDEGEDPNNVLYVGEPDGGIFNNTYTIAETYGIPTDDVADSVALVLEFDYAFMMEPGYDFASVWVGYHRGDESFYDLLGYSGGNLANNGDLYSAFLELPYAVKADSITIAFVVESDGSVESIFAAFDNIAITHMPRVIYTTPGSIFLPAGSEGSSEVVTTVINTENLYPGFYTAFTFADAWDPESFYGSFAESMLDFMIPNNPPVAVDDTIAVMAGDVIMLEDLVPYILSNDYDPDGDWFSIYNVTDPLRGHFKRFGLEEDNDNGPNFSNYAYVAPTNFEGMDGFVYAIMDFSSNIPSIDTATVYIYVMQEPGFRPGMQQQYTVLEDDSLRLGTLGMAAGIGGELSELGVWGESLDPNVTVMPNFGNNALTLKGAPDFWGQVEVLLHMGHFPSGDVMQTRKVTLVVVPVNDPPEANFETEILENRVVFTDKSHDDRDPEGAITLWDWNFGDGATSTDANPEHIYTALGTYTVSLTVTDNAGAISIFEKDVQIDKLSSTETIDLPTVFELKQNYPNPFNPSTQIAFDLPQANEVTLEVFNTLGQKVATLLKGSMVSAGNHSVTFDAKNLSSGIYFYQITAKDNSSNIKTDIKKMILIK